MTKGVPIQYSAAELEFVQAHHTLPRAELTKRFNAKFKREISPENISALCKRKGWATGRNGYFLKGQPCWNKGTKGLLRSNRTSFKKGNRPHTAVPVGTEVITRDWVKVKIAEPNVWKNKANIVWEQHHGIPVPKGEILLHIDGDFRNNHIDNLAAISRGELAVLNKQKFKQQPLAIRRSLVSLVKLKIAINQAVKGNKETQHGL